MKKDNKKADIDRIEKLRKLIDDYRYHYHVLDESIMSEEAADSLKHELSLLEEKYPETVTTDSPTQRVAGQALPGFTQVAHKTRMLSLNDVFSKDEVASWIQRISKLTDEKEFEYFADVKMDGLACSLIYQDGLLVQAVTRGDSFIGEDVTSNVRTIQNVPLRLRESSGFEIFLNGRTEIRGEIVMLKADFEKLNDERRKNGEVEYANPRNLAAGTIRQLDPKLVAKRPLHFRAYDLLRDDQDDIPTNEHAYKTLSSIGITRNQEARVCADLDELMEFVTNWDKRRNDLPFNTDGIVIKLNDRRLFSNLGVVGKQPRGAVAFKYMAEKATSLLKDIIISIGRTGAATPVAVLEPVQVAGTTVTHASLHNADEIQKKDVRIGDTVIVYKAGDIIPQIDSVILALRPDGSKKFNFEMALKKQYPDLNFERPEGDAVYRVKNYSGPLMLKRALEHYASKAALDITTLGEKNVAVLVDNGLVSDLADIYALRYENLINLDRFADISVRKMIEAIADKKAPPLEKFIYGLGIRHVGVQTAIDLVKHFESLEGAMNCTRDELLSIDGIGEVVADSIEAWFYNEDNIELLEKFRNLGVKPYYKKPTGVLAGKSFVITGSLQSMSRDKAADRIRELGGIFQTAIAKDTNFLVVGQKAGGSKLKKAEKNGTVVLSEIELQKMLA